MLVRNCSRDDDAPGGRLPDAAFHERPWRVKAVASDFDLEDVWELPGQGRAGDFRRLVELMCEMDPAAGGGRLNPTRLLWDLRWRLGAVLGWDGEDRGLGGRVASLRERLPEELRDTRPPAFAALPFTPLFITGDEFAAEIANGTMHGVLHLAAVPAPGAPGDDAIRIQMSILVKPNGLTGKAYMLAIRPFRHVIVYPAMMRNGRALWARTA